MSAWDEECDVLVAGSGAGGMAAAYTAAREGLKVILVENTDKFGGTTAYSGGGIYFPNNAALKRANDDDTPEAAKEYFTSIVGDTSPRELQEKYLQTGPQMIDYLEKDSDFFFIIYPWPDYYGEHPKSRPGGRHIAPAPMPRAAIGDLDKDLRQTLFVERRKHAPQEELTGGQSLIGRFLLALSKKPNASLRLNTELTDLVKEGGRVIGAVVKTKDGQKRIRVHGGVIAAAGGFERNAELRERFGIPGDTGGAMGPEGNTGMALLAGIEAGADIDHMDQAWWSPGLMHPDGTKTFTLGFDGGLFVDNDGKRFTNENQAYDRAGRDFIKQMKKGMKLPFWLIFDDRNKGEPPIQYPNVPWEEPAKYQAAGLWRSADTLEELAEKIGVPADALVATVKRFNDNAAKGQDPDFNRGGTAYDTLFVGGGFPAQPLTKGPYHAAAFGLSDLGTKGGLKTDTEARVLDKEGKVIGGLYAAGNTMAPVSGVAYPGGGTPVGSSLAFGYLAALDIAKAYQK